ncbi:MAG: hypothetical protein J7500_15710 [Sphingomonas sp.]|uniref:hypothetical protein n=1 Tax=Sphingomonas sp. TaxID=28214 RepID=UPI001B26A6AC|nr:hypothetical protein [Sphingomonas sp.]MBO9624154.1 hypothetical protein [Sphingomonas sp.]
MTIWSADLTDAQLKMLMASTVEGYGVELRGSGPWTVAGNLVGKGLGHIEGGEPNGSSLPGLFFANDEGIRILREFEPEPGEEDESADAFDRYFEAMTMRGSHDAR